GGETGVFFVRDEGLGIPRDEQARIFEKFYRLDPHMTRGVGGTGLGLYICSELVNRMGGHIWVESKEGEGSTFLLELPAESQVPVRAAPNVARTSEGWAGPNLPPCVCHAQAAAARPEPVLLARHRGHGAAADGSVRGAGRGRGRDRHHRGPARTRGRAQPRRARWGRGGPR